MIDHESWELAAGVSPALIKAVLGVDVGFLIDEFTLSGVLK